MNRELAIAVAIVLVIGVISYSADLSGSATGFAVSQSKSGSYNNKLTINFDKEYSPVNKISVETTLGGEWCSGKAMVRFYDAAGKEVASVTMPSKGAHSTAKKSIDVSDLNVKKAVADADGCSYLDKAKATLEFSRPFMTHITPKIFPSQSAVLAGQASILNAQGNEWALKTVTIKVDGAVKKTCANIGVCAYSFTETDADIGKTRTYTIDAADANGKSGTYAGSYKVYGKVNLKKTATKQGAGGGMESITLDFTNPYNVGFIEVKVKPGGGLLGGGCTVKPSVTAYDVSGTLVQTFNFKSSEDVNGGNIFTYWAILPTSNRISKIVFKVDEEKASGCGPVTRVDSAEATLYYSGIE